MNACQSREDWKRLAGKCERMRKGNGTVGRGTSAKKRAEMEESKTGPEAEFHPENSQGSSRREDWKDN